MACHLAPPRDRPPVIAGCTAGRIGRVTVSGAPPTDVAPLVVLEGTLDDPARTERIVRVAADLLHARGYPRAQVTATRQAGCGVELAVAVDRGPRFRIARLAFQTDDEYPAADRLAAVEDALGTVNTVGGAYVEDRMTRALAGLLRRYNDAGWIEALIDPPVAVYNDRGEVMVTIPIRAGRRFKIGTVVAHGGGTETRAAVIDALGLRGGDWYDASAVHDGVERVRRRLDRRVQVRMEIAFDRRAIDLVADVGASR